ncbi:MAG: response regulator transcription factor, partial [Thermomicrobiales bacterium]|nr:response regulator transcription factor [Thermomicrobiales bacterium]
GETAVQMARSLDARSDLSYTLCGLGYAQLEAGDLSAAAACFLEAMAVTWRRGDLAFLARLHWAFAAIALHRHQPDLAGRLMGAADALDARTGSAMWPNDRALADWGCAQLAAMRPESAVAQLRREGGQFPTEHPVAMALHLAASIVGQEVAAETWARGNGPELPALAKSTGGSLRPVQGHRHLTAREHAVLLHLVDGRTDREIADHLFISRRTVSKHLEAIFAKLGVHSRGAAVAEAQRLGLTVPTAQPASENTDAAGNPSEIRT